MFFFLFLIYKYCVRIVKRFIIKKKLYIYICIESILDHILVNLKLLFHYISVELAVVEQSLSHINYKTILQFNPDFCKQLSLKTNMNSMIKS